MKKKVFLSVIFLSAAAAVSSQTPADTAIVLQQVDVLGMRFSGIGIGEVKRLQVANNLSSLSGTTAEAFRQLPSVVTDMEGGVIFRGSNRTGLLINGIPYGLLEEYNGDVLIQLPALFFTQISVTSYPPVDWIPDGDAGLFNMASAYYTHTDSPVTITLGAGWESRYNAGAVVNLHPGKWHINAKYNYRHEYRERQFSKSTRTATGTSVMNNAASARPDVHIADLFVGYDLTSNDQLSAYGLYYNMDYSRYGQINNTRYNPAGDVVNRMIRHRNNNQHQDAYATEIRWNHLFSHPKEKLDVVLNYNNFGYDEDNDFENENPQTGAIVTQDNLYIHQQKNNYYLSVAYQKGIGDEALFNIGYVGRYRDEQYDAEANDLKAGSWIPNYLKSDTFAFNRLTNMLFLSVEKKWCHFSAEAGLQAEHSRQEVGEKAETSFHFYPRVSLFYRTNQANELRLMYIQRAIRPFGADLNPFIDNADATHIKQGNPDLQNEFIHSLELSWALNLKRFRMAPAVFYRYRTNRLMEVVGESDNFTVWQKANVGSSQTAGVELSVNYNPVSFLTAGLSGDVYRDQIDGRSVGYGEKKSMTCWDAKGFISVSITQDTELQLDGFIVSDQLTPQGKVKSRSSVNAGLSHYFLQRKLRANLSVNNLFDGLGEVTLIDSNVLQMRQVRNRDARVGWLTFTYSL